MDVELPDDFLLLVVGVDTVVEGFDEAHVGGVGFKKTGNEFVLGAASIANDFHSFVESLGSPVHCPSEYVFDVTLLHQGVSVVVDHVGELGY